MSTTSKNVPKDGKLDSVKIKNIPELICTKKPTEGLNNGEYTCRIPFKYMLVNNVAAWYEYKFIGMREVK